MTLEEVLFLFLRADRRPQTTETYSRTLRPFVAAIGPQRPLSLITPEDLDAYVITLRERGFKYGDHPTRPTVAAPLSASTVYKHIKTMKTFFNWCVKRGYVEISPARFLVGRRPGLPLGQGKAATDREVELLLAAARFKLRERAIVLLLARSGCRAGELATLEIADLDLGTCGAFVTGKGGHRRRIYFDEETAEALQAWLARRPAVGHSYVFAAKTGGAPLSPQSVSQIIRRLCRTAGLRSLGAHSFRHRVGLTFARQRVAPRVTQAYLGHSDITITLSYYQDVDENDLRAAGSLLC